MFFQDEQKIEEEIYKVSGPNVQNRVFPLPVTFTRNGLARAVTFTTSTTIFINLCSSRFPFWHNCMIPQRDMRWIIHSLKSEWEMKREREGRHKASEEGEHISKIGHEYIYLPTSDMIDPTLFALQYPC